MKRLDAKQRQWAWFVALWVGGLAAVTLLALVARWMVRIG
jgi:hypothetical protein